MRTFTDWLDHVLESVTNTLTCEEKFNDPVEITIEAERQLVNYTGYNMAGVDIHFNYED